MIKMDFVYENNKLVKVRIDELENKIRYKKISIIFWDNAVN